MQLDNIESDLEEAGDDLQDAYDQLVASIEDEGKMTERVGEYFDNSLNYISDQLEGFQASILDAAGDIRGAEDSSDVEETVHTLEEAGQKLVNASYESRTAFSKGESVLYNGEEALESDVTSVDMYQEAENMDSLQDAMGQAGDAFESYQNVLDKVTSEMDQINKQDGIIGHYDFGLEHQQPEHLT
jgi:chromosome segregation ATPase